MGHKAVVLEQGDTLYVGMMMSNGAYVEVRLAHTPDGMLVTPSTNGDQIIVTGK